MLGFLTLGDISAVVTIISVVGLQITAITVGVRNGRKVRSVHERVDAVTHKVDDVQESLKLPSNPDHSIAAEFEGMSQSLHFLSQLFEDEARSRRSTDKKAP